MYQEEHNVLTCKICQLIWQAFWITQQGETSSLGSHQEEHQETSHDWHALSSYVQILEL